MTNQTPIEEATGYLEARRIRNAMLRQEDTNPIDTIQGKPLTAHTVQLLLEQIQLDGQRLTELRRQLDAAEAQPAGLEQLLTLIADLASADECELDRNGGCQVHNYLSLEPGELCPHAEAKAVLAARKQPEPNPLESAVAEARADIAATPADPEPAPIRHAWLIEAGDD